MTESTLVTSVGERDGSHSTMAVTNADVDWNGFDSSWYSNENYGYLREEDLEILKLVRAYFAEHAPRGARGIDVGAGANLYPALSMLPFCETLDLWDCSSSNVQWLNDQLPSFSSQWAPFWSTLAEHPIYAAIDRPQAALAAAAQAVQANVFDLPERQWSMGTMFFLACSMSTEREQFRRAVRCFLRSLTPGGVFATAFMVGSKGYAVNEVPYPAAFIDAGDVQDCMASMAYDVHVHRITSQNPHRDGFHEMLLVTGRSGF